MARPLRLKSDISATALITALARGLSLVSSSRSASGSLPAAAPTSSRKASAANLLWPEPMPRQGCTRMPRISRA
jgi:hypothetical protein